LENRAICDQCSGVRKGTYHAIIGGFIFRFCSCSCRRQFQRQHRVASSDNGSGDQSHPFIQQNHQGLANHPSLTNPN
jgi:hypothetical protein